MLNLNISMHSAAVYESTLFDLTILSVKILAKTIPDSSAEFFWL